LLARRLELRPAPRLGLVAAAVVFLAQSNLPTVYRQLRDGRAHRDDRRRFLAAVERVRELTPIDAIIAAPSPEADDLAATLRTYAQRAVYVTYKDGGVSILDGARARKWLADYRRQQRAYVCRRPGAFVQFMRDEGIDYALVPEGALPAGDPGLQAAVIDRPDGFLIVRVNRTRPSG
jgi:hypothetical protein